MSIVQIGRCKNFLFHFSKCVFGGNRSLSSTVRGNILRSPLSDVTVPEISVTELVFSKISTYGHHTAVECASTRKKYTYEEVAAKSLNFGKNLRKKFKLREGDAVAIYLPNRPEYFIAALGIMSSGLIVTSLNPLYTPGEISRQLIDSCAKAIITQNTLYNHVKEALHLTKDPIPILCMKERENDSVPQGTANFEEFVNTKADFSAYQPVNRNNIASLPYSSGTTGLPKGVELTHHNLVSNLCQTNHEDINYTIPPSDSHQDVYPGVLPMYHIYGFVLGMLSTLTNGTKTVTMKRFTPDLYNSVLKNHRVSIIYAAPPLVLFLTAHPEIKPEYFQSLRIIMSGAAPLSRFDEERFLEKARRPDITISQVYGLTETSPLMTHFSKYLKKSEKPGGSIGKPISNTFIKIISPEDPTGKPLGPREPGELLVKGPQVMRGYHNKHEETSNAFLDDWFKTGDLAHYDEDGYIFITDRLKELIKVKGYSVAPAELEAIIRLYPTVGDVAVIGVPHPAFGEVPRAFVVPKKDEIVNTEHLQHFVSQQVAKYKHLVGGVKVVDSIPKNPSGKILRRELRRNQDV